MNNKNSYKPTFSEDYEKKLRQWQDNVYKESKTRETQHIQFLDRLFTIPPRVHPINPMSDLLGNAVLQEVKEGDRVLDMGTGSGVNAILAASKSREVIAVDINPEAIKCAKKNAKMNKVDSVVSFKVSDVFTNVKGKFDLIIFDPPFRWFHPRDIYEVATTDQHYQTLRTFFFEVEKYLNKSGRILLCFGSSGDITYLKRLIRKCHFHRKIIAKRSLEKEGINVYYYSFRLTM